MKQKLNAYARLMRIDKPVGILLLFWPTLGALFLAANGMPDWRILVIFTIGTVLMRSAGCVMNDIADMQYDGHVKRTNNRPLITKEVTKKEAYALVAVLSLISFALVLTLNALTIKLSVVALLLAASYPLTKRFLSIPQAYLGLAFGFGIPMAFAAITGEVPIVAWWLMIANVFWAVAYDTQYAMVDRDDDLKIGIHSSAITFGQYDVTMVMACYAAMLLVLAKVGCDLALNQLYFIGLCIAGLIAAYHYQLIKTRTRALCFKAFLHNIWFGMAIFMGIFISTMQ